jgi:hypothetical protein
LWTEGRRRAWVGGGARRRRRRRAWRWGMVAEGGRCWALLEWIKEMG